MQPELRADKVCSEKVSAHYGEHFWHLKCQKMLSVCPAFYGCQIRCTPISVKVLRTGPTGPKPAVLLHSNMSLTQSLFANSSSSNGEFRLSYRRATGQRRVRTLECSVNVRNNIVYVLRNFARLASDPEKKQPNFDKFPLNYAASATLNRTNQSHLKQPAYCFKVFHLPRCRISSHIDYAPIGISCT